MWGLPGLGLCGLALAVQVGGCTGVPRETPNSERFAVLTTDGYLTVVRAADGIATERIRIAPDALPGDPGRYLAYDPRSQRLFALLHRTHGRAAAIAKITIGTKAPHVERRPLHDLQADFRSIALAKRSGALLVAGAAPNGVTVARVRTDDLDQQTIATVDSLVDVDWRVYDVAVNAAEDSLYISYHGSRTTGIDVFDIPGLRMRSCERVPPNNGCLPAHGRLARSSTELLAATGRRFVYRYRRAARDSIDLGLDTHLMEPCGERSAVLPREGAIVATHGEGQVSIIDLQTGAIVQTVALPSQALDVLVIDRVPR